MRPGDDWRVDVYLPAELEHVAGPDEGARFQREGLRLRSRRLEDARSLSAPILLDTRVRLPARAATLAVTVVLSNRTFGAVKTAHVLMRRS